MEDKFLSDLSTVTSLQVIVINLDYIYIYIVFNPSKLLACSQHIPHLTLLYYVTVASEKARDTYISCLETTSYHGVAHSTPKSCSKSSNFLIYHIMKFCANARVSQHKNCRSCQDMCQKYQAPQLLFIL
jgi:hypothetical protein